MAAIYREKEQTKKRKIGDKEQKKKGKKKSERRPHRVWKKKSIFFKLPYWKVLLVRHNLDVMDIEKNICDSILGTLLNLKGKSKDGLKSRKDLEAMQIRQDLHTKAAMGRLDGIVDTVSAAYPLFPLIRLLKTDGKLVIVGAPEKALELPVFPLLMGRKVVTGSKIGGMKETQEMIDFAANKHKLSMVKHTLLDKSIDCNAAVVLLIEKKYLAK